MTDRASRRAREALLGAKTKGRAKSSLAKLCSWMERDGSNWYDSIGDPSAGDFCGVLRALDGEIAVEIDGEDYVIYDGGWRYIEPPSTPIHCSNHKVVPENWIEQADSVRLLHRDDPELPLAVREAMEDDP